MSYYRKAILLLASWHIPSQTSATLFIYFFWQLCTSQLHVIFPAISLLFSWPQRKMKQLYVLWGLRSKPDNSLVSEAFIFSLCQLFIFLMVPFQSFSLWNFFLITYWIIHFPQFLFSESPPLSWKFHEIQDKLS